ncbi:hypothetical protein H4F20_03290 [Vibrio sp. 16]|uniref:hypothetical protein n=1 Tax=Vibrio sp. 16 TaxID=391586 RepID=UPI002FF11BF3
MKGILRGYEVILFPASIGLFVAFAQDSAAFYVIFPLLVLAWFQSHQQRKIASLESELREVKRKLNTNA